MAKKINPGSIMARRLARMGRDPLQLEETVVEEKEEVKVVKKSKKKASKASKKV